jgi:hypothetical protein
VRTLALKDKKTATKQKLCPVLKLLNSTWLSWMRRGVGEENWGTGEQKERTPDDPKC